MTGVSANQRNGSFELQIQDLQNMCSTPLITRSEAYHVLLFYLEAKKPIVHPTIADQLRTSIRPPRRSKSMRRPRFTAQLTPISNVHGILNWRLPDRIERQEREESQVLGRHHVYRAMVHKSQARLDFEKYTLEKPANHRSYPEQVVRLYSGEAARWTDAAQQ
jgi:hypothetical protein